MERPNRVIGAIMLLAAAIALAVTLWSSHEQRVASNEQQQSTELLVSYIQCQSDLNQKFIETIKARASISDADRTSIRNLVTKVFTQNNSPEDAQNAANLYFREQVQLDKLRSGFKFPDVTTCGQLRKRSINE